MLFNSWEFLILLVTTTLLYYIPFFKRFQVSILIVASCVFYGFNQPYLLILLSISAIFSGFLSIIAQSDLSQKAKKSYTICGVIFNLSILGFFKYSSLFTKTLFTIPEKGSFADFLISIPLPIGISFYSFQGISLVVDSFKGKKLHEGKSVASQLKENFLFIIFFPQLVAGPIVKAHDFIPQVRTKKLANIDIYFVVHCLIVGYFLKLVIADNLKDHTFWITYPYFSGKSSVTLMTLLFGYSMQIFADFAGYSFIAIGIGAIFGYRLPQNFNLPYISSSFSEFWKRWHISLSSFLSEYLYIPLGGNRKGRIRTYLNLMLVMILGGLWHGAAWSYAIWGFIHGVALAIERALGQNYRPDGLLLRLIKVIVVFSAVSFAWLFFKLPSYQEAFLFLSFIKENTGIRHDYPTIVSILFYSLPVVLYHFWGWLKEAKPLYFSDGLPQLSLVHGILLFLIIINSGSSGEFIYFQF